jgi:hypothetical protein
MVSSNENFREDLKTIAELGLALWADPHYSSQVTSETFMAASMIEVQDDLRLERAAQALLDRAVSEGHSRNTTINARVPGAINDEFFRLGVKERFVLVGLHFGKWSYARLSRVCGVSAEEIEELAWRARLTMAGPNYPQGASLASQNCPEYIAARPWTQRILDDEWETGGGRMFLQNHLMACDSCRAALGRSRQMYYSVEARIPRSVRSQELSEVLDQITRRTHVLRQPSERTIHESFSIFTRRREARLLIALLFGFLVFWIYKLSGKN